MSQRLRTILRLQRDEFLPLRVIRQELASGRAGNDVAPASDGAVAGTGAARRKRNPSVTAPSSGALYSLEDVIEETRAEARLVSRARGVRGHQGRGPRAATKYYDETEREIVRAVTELARYGVGGRNLRAFRTSADREAALLQQILAPALRSRNAQRRKEAVEALENLAAVTTHLKHLLLIRDLRKIALLRAGPWRSTSTRSYATSRLPEAGHRLQGHHARPGLPRGARRGRDRVG